MIGFEFEAEVLPLHSHRRPALFHRAPRTAFRICKWPGSRIGCSHIRPLPTGSSLEMFARQGMRCPIRDIEIELFRYGREDYSRVFVCDSNIEIGQVKY